MRIDELETAGDCPGRPSVSRSALGRARAGGFDAQAEPLCGLDRVEGF
jgi:hypothetical protein